MEIILFISYLIVAFLFKSKLAVVALLGFILSYLSFDLLGLSAFRQHIFYLLMSAPLLFFGDKISKVCVLAFIIFQYVMAWDAFLQPESATFLYNIYQMTAFVLHLLIISSIYRNGVLQHGGANFNIDTIILRLSSFKFDSSRN